MGKIDLMIFDFDGTTVNSGEDIATSVNSVTAVQISLTY
jgi:phosphoglycolate phosphatase-like HAD superfamily hydrolase